MGKNGSSERLGARGDELGGKELQLFLKKLNCVFSFYISKIVDIFCVAIFICIFYNEI